MNRTTTNVLIDSAALLLFLGMIATGYVLRFPLPPGTNRVLSLWGLTRHQWGGIHYWMSLTLLGVIAVHVALHWKWAVSVVGKRLGWVVDPHASMFRTGIAATGILVIAFGLFAFVVHWSVREMAEPLHELNQPDDTNAGKAGSPTSGAPNAVSQAAFWRDVYPIFESRCISCHGPSRQLAGFRVDQREDFFSESREPPLIVPGSSVESPLITIVSGAKADMRLLDKHQLPERELSLLRTWIDAGANWPDVKK